MDGLSAERSHKTCSLCGERKPLAAFYRNGGGYSSQCKSCNSAYKAWRYRQNPEPARAAMQRYRQKRRDVRGPEGTEP